MVLIIEFRQEILLLCPKNNRHEILDSFFSSGLRTRKIMKFIPYSTLKLCKSDAELTLQKGG